MTLLVGPKSYRATLDIEPSILEEKLLKKRYLRKLSRSLIERSELILTYTTLPAIAIAAAAAARFEEKVNEMTYLSYSMSRLSRHPSERS